MAGSNEPAAPGPPSLLALRAREDLATAVLRRRAGQPRRGKALDEPTKALLAAILRDHPAPDLSAELQEARTTHVRDSSWNRYRQALAGWFKLCADAGVPAFPKFSRLPRSLRCMALPGRSHRPGVRPD